MLEIGSVIDGKYKILNEIGHGGMSTVYLAMNEKANKTWAVKEVRRTCAGDYEVFRQSLIAETDFLKRLRHPSLPCIVDVIDHDGNFLIVMDYIEGKTLERLISENGAQTQEDVVGWALQLCSVLEYLHSRPVPIIYRDMKPSNIMLRSDGSVVLIDFGTAREFKEKSAADTSCLGTQGYAAPEQFGGMGQTDARTDIYCLGATLYHLVTGHNPCEPPYEMYPITEWDGRLSSGLERIILKCTQKDPANRYQDVRSLCGALERYHDLETQVQRQCRRKAGLFLAAAVLSVLCAAAAWGFDAAAAACRSDAYQDALAIAGYMTDSADAAQRYMDAAGIDAVRPQAYHEYYNAVIEDGCFTAAEEAALLRLNMDKGRPLQRFARENPREYADFCYEMGNAYWYYYVHGENRQSNAVPWFEEAMRRYADNAERAAEYRRCSLYVEIGGFYRKIAAAQIDGSDAGMYGAYWKKLSALKALNDAQPDRDMITLRMYREIVSRAAEYAKYLREDGIPQEDIRTLLADIEADMRHMEETATSAVNAEIVRIRGIMDMADKMVSSSYR